MFDVEKMKKVNELAKELQKHNFADDSQTAYKFAEQVYSEKFNEIVESPTQEAQAPEQPQQKFTESSNEISSLELIEKKYQLILEMNNKRFNEDIASLKQQVQDLNSEIERLQLIVRRLEEKIFEQKHLERQEKLNIPEKKETSKESHPRQGDFKPEDVPIEKFFYFGK